MFEAIKNFFKKKTPVEVMKVEFVVVDGLNLAGWYITSETKAYAGPYKREKDAKGQLTRLRKGYTPAARKV